MIKSKRDRNMNKGVIVGRIGIKEEIPLKKRKRIKISAIGFSR